MPDLSTFAKVWIGAAAALAWVCGQPASAQPTEPAETQPNILWIVTDDHRPDSIRAYNRAVHGTDYSPLGYVESPNTDRLAAEGVLFVNAFNNAPVCAPSRGSVHSGRYPFRTGHLAFELTHQMPDFVRPTVTQLLRDLGYTTATFGKADAYIYGWGPGQGFHDAGLWDHRVHFKNDLQRQGFGDLVVNNVYDTTGGKWVDLGRAETTHYPNGTIKQHFLSRTDGPLTEADKAAKDALTEEFDLLRGYTRRSSDIILGGVNPMPADRTIDARVVEEFENHLLNAGQPYQTLWGKPVQGPDPDKPLLMHLGFHLPHTPVLPPKSVRDRFRQHTYDIPAFDDEEFAGMPPQLQEIHVAGQVDEMTEAEMQQMAQDYYAFCAHGDALLGRAVGAFKKHCEEQGRPWLILFQVGDHGWHLGEQGISAKFSPWRQSVGNALIVVSSDKSRFPAGVVNRQLVEYVDVAPTLLQAGGADLADDSLDHLDGYSLLDVHNGVHLERAYALGEISVIAGPRAYLHTDRFRFSMRTRPFNGSPPPNMIGRDIEWALTAPVEDVDLALYDLAVDPLERDNVADDPAYRALAAFLRDKLGRIVLGDGRVEVDWSKPNTYSLSNFAAGADDKVLDIPPSIVPAVENPPRNNQQDTP